MNASSFLSLHIYPALLQQKGIVWRVCLSGYEVNCVEERDGRRTEWNVQTVIVCNLYWNRRPGGAQDGINRYPLGSRTLYSRPKERCGIKWSTTVAVRGKQSDARKLTNTCTCFTRVRTTGSTDMRVKASYLRAQQDTERNTRHSVSDYRQCHGRRNSGEGAARLYYVPNTKH